MEILRGYLPGPNLLMLLHRYWDKQVVVPKAGKFFGRPYGMERGVNQGDPIYLTTFNIMVVAVVREVLLEVYGTQEAHHRLGWAAVKHNIVFYADGGRIVGRNPIWVQTNLKARVRFFERLGLLTNIGDNKEMVCTPRFIWGQHGTADYKRRLT